MLRILDVLLAYVSHVKKTIEDYAMNKRRSRMQCFEIFNKKQFEGSDDFKLKSFEKFFYIFNNLYQELHEKTIHIPTIDVFNKFFTEFNVSYAPFFASGATINVWQVAQLKHNELRNCSVLRWLLDCEGSHGQGSIFFEAVLKHLDINIDITNGYRTQVELSYILDEDYNDSNEYGNNTEKYNRVDIVMQNTQFLLFLEVKIDAPEGINQLLRYSDILKKQCGSRKGKLIYLTPRHKYLPEAILSLQDKSKYFPKPLSWKEVANAFENVLPEYIQKQNAMQKPLWVSLVQQFCEHIRKF